MFHVDFIRRRASGYAPAGAFPDPITRLIDEERRADYEGTRAHFVSETFVVATYLPPREICSRLATVFISGAGKSQTAWDGVLAAFEAAATQIERRHATPLQFAP